MFKLHLVNWTRKAAKADVQEYTDRRGQTREPVFREAVLRIEDYYQIRAVITDLSPGGARVQYATRTDLPFRLLIIAPTLKLKCWARVVWQRDGAAGLAFHAND